MEFTKEQKDIFEFVQNKSGHGIIDAVAGAGKTTTIMECARYVENKSDILFCAFNKSIANEIKRKFREQGLSEVTVKTIHALGYEILKAHNHTGGPIKIENQKYNKILRAKEFQEKLESHFREMMRLHDLNPDSFDKRVHFAIKNLVYEINANLLEINQKYRSTLTTDSIEKFRELVIHFGIFNSFKIKNPIFKKELKIYFECHQLLLEEANAFSKDRMIFDFTDMLYLPVKWKLGPLKKYNFLFIDECQDLSKSQFAIATMFGNQDGRILAVGDPSQSIYGFTGADIESFERVQQYTNAIELPLTTCFRCPKQIIKMASEIRPDITGSKAENGEVVRISDHQVIELAKPGDLIISRLKSNLTILIFEFIDRNIAVKIHEDEAIDFTNELKRLFKSDELNKTISTLPGGFNTLRTKVNKRWNFIIDKKAEKIANTAQRALYVVNEKKFIKQKLDFFEKKYRTWEGCTTIFKILERIKTFISEKKNPIRLSSIHRAKGLEEKRIFILDFDELPMIRTGQKEWEMTQELNLKYVAITRAKETLFLVNPTDIADKVDEGSLFDNLPFEV